MAARLYDGFGPLPGGMDGGSDASLIGQDQVAAASNATFRGDLMRTRPPWIQRAFTFSDEATEANWSGVFQGVMDYDGESGQSGWVIARGGRLFFMDNTQFQVREITPSSVTSVSIDFTVPIVGDPVDIRVNVVDAISVGQTLLIDSGEYEVSAIFQDGFTATYNGGAANATCPAGATVNDSNNSVILAYKLYSTSEPFRCMFQAENYAVILGGQYSTVIYDGANCRLAGIGEIPCGSIGAYGWGRIWIARPDLRTFVAGDLVYGPSGSPQFNKRDAILKFTENDFMNEGGAFGVPYNSGPITSMQFLATQDTSLGIGVLLVGTTNMVFSVNAPVDRTAWKNLQYPIQTVSLIDYGPQGPRSTISANGDMFYRSSDGFRSFVVARRNFGVPGNTPLSREISPIVDGDTSFDLFYGSGMLFDNRLVWTVSPFRTEHGIEHRGLVSMNFDSVSNLRKKSSPTWEGVWSGLSILQVVRSKIRGEERGFIFSQGASGIELWEMMRNGEGTYDKPLGVNVSIQGFAETRSMDFQGSGMVLKWLRMAELYIDQIADNFSIVVKWRPDQYPIWTTWGTIEFCANVSQCSITATVNGQCSIWKQRAKQYATRVTLPQPPESVNPIPGAPLMQQGREFQFRLEWTGSARIRKFIVHADPMSQPSEGYVNEPTCVAIEDCGTNWFPYDIDANIDT